MEYRCVPFRSLRNRPACAPSSLASAIIIQSRSRWSHAAARLEDIRLSPSPAVAHAPDQPDSSASVERLHQLVLRSLDDEQAIDVVSIPLSGKTSIADHLVIGSARTARDRKSVG